MSYSLVAVISDVHANAPALAAVLAELERERPDLVVFGGDLTWGSLPLETLELVRGLETPTRFVRGNGERGLGEPPDTERARWIVHAHSRDALEFVAGFEEQFAVEVDGLGPVRFCHGSPRSDEELVTPETPEARVRAFLEGVSEQVLVTAHTHVQFDREVAGIRSLNAGSVGMPYEGRQGAYWALLGPGVDLRCTEYSVEETIARYRASGDPMAEEMVEILLAPPSREEAIEQSERLEFAG
jgi:putative phosphoesterase